MWFRSGVSEVQVIVETQAASQLVIVEVDYGEDVVVGSLNEVD